MIVIKVKRHIRIRAGILNQIKRMSKNIFKYPISIKDILEWK
jgi:hypothetical protein